jgi:hypothetical protein
MGLGLIGVAGGWWLVIRITQATPLADMSRVIGIMGVGYLIASGIRLWQLRHSDPR